MRCSGFAATDASTVWKFASRRSIVSGSNRSDAYPTSACSEPSGISRRITSKSKRDQLHPGTGRRSSSKPAMRCGSAATMSYPNRTWNSGEWLRERSGLITSTSFSKGSS